MTTERIALVGGRGTGKTTVGRLVAAGLGWPFADADDVLEATARQTVAELFREFGEDGFRLRESVTLASLVAAPQLVLATGGGAVLWPANRRMLKSCGLVAWLTAPPAVLWERIRGDGGRRPNLAGGGLAEVEAVMAAREPLYREVATHTLDTAGQSPADVAAAILRGWRAGDRPTPPG